MNTEDAKLILAAVHHDAEPDSDTEQAFALLDSDTALLEWFGQEQAFDHAIANKLAEIEPPADLKANLITLLDKNPPSSRPTTLPKNVSWFRPPLLAAAAALILIPLFAFPLFTGKADAKSFDAFRHDMVEFAGGEFQLDHTDSNLPALYDWLNANNATCPTDLSASVELKSSIGCKVIEWNKESVTLICLRNKTDDVIHCFVLPRDEFKHLPDEKLLDSRFTMDELETYSWVDRDYLYFLVGSKKGVKVPIPKR